MTFAAGVVAEHGGADLPRFLALAQGDGLLALHLASGEAFQFGERGFCRALVRLAQAIIEHGLDGHALGGGALEVVKTHFAAAPLGELFFSIRG